MVQTRSTYRRIEESRQVHEGNEALPQDTTVEFLPGDGAARLAKSRRRERAKVPKKRRRRKPREICQLNLDVLHIIAEYIQPLDLLNLARTCKSLRRLLMDNSSASVWKIARRQVLGLPACPADLTEPEYADLAFHARCHSCGKYTKTILWEMRRRYCPGCRAERLCCLSFCPEIIRKNPVLATESLTIEKESAVWIDRKQMYTLMHEYRCSSDKQRFLSDREEQHNDVFLHACECRAWEEKAALQRKEDQELRRQERDRSIFERLERQGYGCETSWFGAKRIRESHKSAFTTCKPLTDKEWTRMWPEWLEIMNKLRWKRIDATVWQPRRALLRFVYCKHMLHPSSDGPTLDLLPNVVDLGYFTPFRDIIRAPAETQVNERSFEPAFAQLPVLVDEWRKKLDAELAALVKIPPRLSLEDSSGARATTPRSTTCAELSEAATDKLRLACAVFCSTSGVFTHPDILLVSLCLLKYTYDAEDPCELERHGSIRDRFDFDFLHDAPYIVHACGLDPNMATVNDMDRQNARLKCMRCANTSHLIMDWRYAMWHAGKSHQPRLLHLSEEPSWQPISGENISAIRPIEPSTPDWVQCLLCSPCVGEASTTEFVMWHMKAIHKIPEDDIKLGVHYVRLGIR